MYEKVGKDFNFVPMGTGKILIRKPLFYIVGYTRAWPMEVQKSFRREITCIRQKLSRMLFKLVGKHYKILLILEIIYFPRSLPYFGIL